MKKFFLTTGLLLVCGCVFAQQDEIARMIEMEAVRVTSTRATGNTPVAHTNINKSEIAAVNYGQDLPFLLQTTPSVVATSDAGAGVGYTGIRIRGTDATRINVTTNGIPMNDAESHILFWVNTPDIASSLADIQVQRGVGTSTNGAGAFGGSINMKTESVASHPFAEFSGSYGSFNTHRQTVKLGSGLLGGRWALSARLSNMHSDGYVRRASTDLQSYMAQAGYYAERTAVRLIIFGGREKTYHAWNGISRGMLATDRRYNSCGEMWDGDNFLGFYDDQTDNYLQTNYQLHLTQKLGGAWSLNAALHFTKGDGYYEEYKNDCALEHYGLGAFAVAENGAQRGVETSNLVRRKEMDNTFGGGVFSLDYTSDKLHASLGGALNRYDGDHFGRVLWVREYAGSPALTPDHRYYENEGGKTDGNVYAKANWQVTSGLWLYGDLQYRRIDYSIEGANDKWDEGAGAMQRLDVEKVFDFFNPKAGAYYSFNKRLSVYGSVAVAHREPTRNNYTDARTDRAPKAERLTDYELGASYRGDRFSAGANLYYMKYKDQLVLTGEVNHIGEPLADNVPDSYRAGVELTVGLKPLPWLSWDVNATLSRNRIRDYTEYIDTSDADWNPVQQTANRLGDTDISFSPSLIAGSLITARHRGFTLALQSNYVGKQYLTNSASALGAGDYLAEEGSRPEDLTLDGYFVNNLRLSYEFRTRSLTRITAGITVYNIFNEKYCSNGGGGSYAVSNPLSPRGYDRYNYAWFFPQATANVLANLTINF